MLIPTIPPIFLWSIWLNLPFWKTVQFWKILNPEKPYNSHICWTVRYSIPSPIPTMGFWLRCCSIHPVSTSALFSLEKGGVVKLPPQKWTTHFNVHPFQGWMDTFSTGDLCVKQCGTVAFYYLWRRKRARKKGRKKEREKERDKLMRARSSDRIKFLAWFFSEANVPPLPAAGG